MNIVSVRTFDDICLKGLYLNNGTNKRCCLIVPGCCGNFIDNSFLLEISKYISGNGYDVLCANTRGSFMMNSSFHPYNLERPRKIGATYEIFEDCVYDIDAWISFLKKVGYESINLIGHSMGCNKIIYYLNQRSSNEMSISNVVFLSPPDFAHRIRCYDDYEDIMQEALENVRNGQPEKLVSVHFFYKTSIGFLQMMNSTNFDNIPLILGEKENFQMYSNIKIPLTIIYGSKEGYIKNYIYKLRNFASLEADFEEYEILDADHIYCQKEADIAKAIVSSLDGRYGIVQKKLNMV